MSPIAVCNTTAAATIWNVRSAVMPGSSCRAAAGIFADGISSALFALGMVAAGAAVLLLFVAPGRGYVALGDADTDTDTGTSGDPDPGADPAPVGAAGGTSGYPVAGSQEVRRRPAR